MLYKKWPWCFFEGQTKVGGRFSRRLLVSIASSQLFAPPWGIGSAIKKSADFKWCLKYGTERSESILKACYPQVSGVYHDLIMISMTQTGYKIKGGCQPRSKKTVPWKKQHLKLTLWVVSINSASPAWDPRSFPSALSLSLCAAFLQSQHPDWPPGLAKYMVSMLRLR